MPENPALKDPSIDFEYPFIPNYQEDFNSHTQFISDFEQTLDLERLRKYRIGRVKEQLRKNNVGAILTLGEWNMRYSTSTWNPYWTTPASGLRYSLQTINDDAPILYEQGEIGYHAKNIAPWLKKVKVAITGAGWIGQTMGPNAWHMQRDKMVEQIKRDLTEAGVANARLAVDTWDPHMIEGFENAGIKCVPGGMMMFMARQIKNLDEITCQKIACAIGDAEFATLAAGIKPGVRESELTGKVHETCYRLGGRIYSGVFVTSGPHAWPNPRDESDRMIRPGDTVYMDVYNSSYLGYKLCYYRTFSCGKADPRLHDAYKKSRDWLYDAINAIKPGVTTKEIAEKWPAGPDIWEDILVKSEDQTAGSNWAHGIGLTLYEPPIIWRAASLSDPVVLEENMTFAIETQHGIPGVGGVRIEEMIRVTKNGVEVMSKWPVEQITECPLF